jgi:ABC-type sugar transport system permease subunit
MSRQSRLLPFLLLLPALLIIGIVQLYPAIYSIQISFNRVAGGNLTPIGTRNYAVIFASSGFQESLWHTAIFLIGYVVLTMLIGLGIALLLNRKLRLRGAYVTLLFIPWVLSDVIVGLVFKLFVDPDTGILAPFFAQPFFGLDGSALLTKVPAYLASGIPFPPAPAMLYLILAASWKALPFVTILILAALQTVPREVLESASIDGATAWQSFKSIVFPLVLPSLVVALFNLILGGMNGVGMVFSLTGGGPGTATEVLSYLLYQVGFGALDFGRAAALSVFIAVINLALILAAVRISRSGAERYA